ncbi:MULTISPECIES: hypothetical protein [unclassified Bradyrhizobium]|uniref:hypothetical protein n=1 Tax=unclassified Bradyrhizobium TaxID=2631580 RepID=UPI0028E8F3DA|nr:MULTISPECIES: hypothetical protein [unclassified Bradyrhizobium]
MSTRKVRLLGRTAVAASILGLTLGALAPTSANARPRHWQSGGAAAAAVAGAVGFGLAAAAARDAYAYDYGGPAYVDGPVYYGGPAHYDGPGYYGYYPAGHFPYQRYGGDSPYSYCAQGTTWNCQ